MDFFSILQNIFIQQGYLAVFGVLLACGFGVPIPEDVSLVSGGIIAGLGYADVRTMCMVGIAGVLMGDGLMFMAGKIYGTEILKFRLIAYLMTPKRYAQVQQKFERYGNWVLFVARFLPGLRTPIFLTAGMSQKVSFWRFLMMDGLAALISVPIWVYLGYWGASNIEALKHVMHQFQLGIFAILASVATVLIVLWWRRRQR